MRLPVKATHQATREHNVRLVLRAIADMGPISRADIARRTDLTRTTVSDVVGQLADAGLVVEIGRGPSSGGKAPILLQIPRDARQLIGLHIGDEQVRGVVVNLAGDIIHRAQHPVHGRDGAHALSQLDALVDELMQAAGTPPVGIGIGTPGLVDTQAGVVRWAASLDWRDLPLATRVADRTGLPVYVANDSQAAALAEWTFGRHVEARAMVAIRVGIGIGAGIIIDDRLYQGDGFGAGEIGHTTVLDEGPPCRCGRLGCLEAVASLRAVLERVEHDLHRWPGTTDLERALAGFTAGDPAIREAVLDAGAHLGRALGSIIDTLDIRYIVLVGPMALFGQPWLEAVRGEARRSALPLLGLQTIIELGNLGPDVEELGAAALLMTAEIGLSQAA